MVVEPSVRVVIKVEGCLRSSLRTHNGQMGTWLEAEEFLVTQTHTLLIEKKCVRTICKCHMRQMGESSVEEKGKQQDSISIKNATYDMF